MEFLTVQEVAKLLQLNQITVLRKIANGDIKSVKFGRRHRIEKTDLESFIAKEKQ